MKLIDAKGKSVSDQTIPVKLESFLRTDIPISLTLPAEKGGYVLVAEFTPDNGTPVTSRRFLKVGKASQYSYFNLNPAGK